MRLRASRAGIGITEGKIYEGQVLGKKNPDSLFGGGWIVLVYNDNGQWVELSLSIFEGLPVL